MLSQLAPWFGYLASLLLALGLMVSNNLRFRWLNAGGCIAFIFYGILLNAPPVILTNGILLTINIYYLWKIYNHKELFELVEFGNSSMLIDRFLDFYQKDIAAYFPEFKPDHFQGGINFIVLRDLVIANIFSARPLGNGDAEVIINYTVVKYRDYKVGRFIFEKEKQFLISKGVQQLIYRKVANHRHEKFLKVMGFVQKSIDGKNCLVKILS